MTSNTSGHNGRSSVHSYAEFRRAMRGANLELHDGRRKSQTIPTRGSRRAGQRDGDATTVRFRSHVTGRRMTIRVSTEDNLIEDGDALAATKSEEVHSDSKPDLGGWTGGTVWEASQALARVLVEQQPEFWDHKRRVVELGCGCGLCGLVAAGLGAREVVLTDQVLFVAEHNLRHAGLPPHVQRQVRVEKLKWGDDADVRAISPPFDLLLGGDIMYFPGHYKVLADTIIALTAVGSEVLWVTRDGSPDDGIGWPAEPFYKQLRCAGFRCDDITSTATVAKVLRTVRRQFTVEQSGRGPLCVVWMVRTNESGAENAVGNEDEYPDTRNGQPRAAL